MKAALYQLFSYLARHPMLVGALLIGNAVTFATHPLIGTAYLGITIVMLLQFGFLRARSKEAPLRFKTGQRVRLRVSCYGLRAGIEGIVLGPVGRNQTEVQFETAIFLHEGRPITMQPWQAEMWLGDIASNVSLHVAQVPTRYLELALPRIVGPIIEDALMIYPGDQYMILCDGHPIPYTDGVLRGYALGATTLESAQRAAYSRSMLQPSHRFSIFDVEAQKILEFIVAEGEVIV